MNQQESNARLGAGKNNKSLTDELFRKPIGLEEWPSFYQLTELDDPDPHYYKGWKDGVLQPAFHWCYFAEITAPRYHPFRTSILVKDLDGFEHPIIFYVYDEIPGFPHPFAPAFQAGYTIAILYAERKVFMDSTEGIRQENEEFKVFKCSLQSLYDEHRKLELPSKECFWCGKRDGTKLSFCGKCKLACYCGTECQMLHWKKVHKGLCHDMKLLKNLLVLLKQPFRRFSSFSMLNSVLQKSFY
jgi:hypothetical protein